MARILGEVKIGNFGEIPDVRGLKECKGKFFFFFFSSKGRQTTEQFLANEIDGIE